VSVVRGSLPWVGSEIFSGAEEAGEGLEVVTVSVVTVVVVVLECLEDFFFLPLPEAPSGAEGSDEDWVEAQIQ